MTRPAHDALAPQLARFRSIIEGPRNEAIDDWLATGAPVVGVSCSYVPPEVIWAAGALPIRLRGAGSRDSSTADA